MVDVIFLGLGLGLLIIGVIATILAGIRNLSLGKSSPKKIVIMLVPIVVFGIAFAVTGSADQAGIATMFVMMAAMFVAIAFTGLKGTFKL